MSKNILIPEIEKKRTIEEFCETYQEYYMKGESWAINFAKSNHISGNFADVKGLQAVLKAKENEIIAKKESLKNEKSENVFGAQKLEIKAKQNDVENIIREGSTYIKARERNLQYAKENKGFEYMAENNVQVLCMQYPGYENLIKQKAYNPTPDKVEKLFEMHLVLREWNERETYPKLSVVEYLKCLKNDKVLSHPKFTAENMRVMIYSAVGLLLLGLILGIFVDWIWFLLLTIASVVQFFGGQYMYNDFILKSIPWEEISLYNYILCFNEEYAEQFSRKECGLPVESSETIKQRHLQVNAKMEDELTAIKEKIAILEKEIQKKNSEMFSLEKAYNAHVQQAQIQGNIVSRIVQKESRKIELSVEEVSIIGQYRAEKLRMKLQLTACKTDVDNKKKKHIDLYNKMNGLLEKIRNEKDEYRKTKKQAILAERVLESLNEKERLKEEALIIEKAEQDAQEKFNKTIEKSISVLDAELLRIQNLQKVIIQESREHSKEIWQENCRRWFEFNEKNIFSPNGEFKIKPYAYVFGSDGPYRLDHDNRPMVLIYDYDSSQFNGENRPAYYLEKTISALKFAISTINNIGLTSFSVIDEYGGGGSLPYKIYDASTVKQLATEIKTKKELLQSESYGRTINECNQNQAIKYMESGLLDNERDILKQLYKMHYVFILPQFGAERRLLNSNELWTMIKGNCGDYGFVPIFLLPQDLWDETVENKTKGMHSKEILLLSELSNVYVKKISLN